MPDQDFNVTDPVFAWAVRAPNAVAIIEQGRITSYRALAMAVRHAMQRLLDAGCHHGDVIGVSISGEFSLRLVVTLALARIGASQVSLPPGDLAARRVSIAQTLGIKAVVANHDNDGLGAIARLRADAGWLAAADTDPLPPDSRSPGGDKVWIINHSSGTTGEPKSVHVSHDRFRTWSGRLTPIFDFQPGERFMNMVDLRFWVGVWRALVCLGSGGAVVALPETFTAGQLLHWIDLHHVTYLQCTPFHIHWLLQEQQGSDDAPRLPGLRILRCGSAELAPSLLQKARARLSPNVYLTYGANEAGTLTAATPDILARFPDSVGMPLPGVELEIADTGGLRVAAGTTGRLRARGAQMSPSGGNDWIYPGDTALQNELGVVFLKGRYDDVMNFDGILISPMEIESVLALHPAVADVAAFPLPSPQHQDVPAVALVLKQALPMDEFDRYCRQQLGMRAPRAFILVDQIPRNDMGKVLRRRLTEIALARLAANATKEE